MKRIMLAGMFFLGFTSFLSLNAQWAITYGGSSRDYADSVQQTSDGGYIVRGSTQSFGAGGNDIWILKLSPDGDIEWQKTYGGNSSGEFAHSIQQTNDGGYILVGETDSFGAGRSDIWILKLSPDGDIEWQRTYGGSSSDSASSFLQTNDGGYIVVGETDSFGAVGGDIWMLKLSPDGEVEWQKTYGGNYSGDVAHSIQQTSDEGYIITGQTSSWGDGAQEWVDEIWVLKLLPNGDINPRCAFIKNSNGQVSDTDIMPEDSDIIPEDSDIIPEDTNITPHDTSILPRDTDANVYKLCVSDICTLTLSASSGGTTNPAPGIHTYDTGTEVTLKAIPSDDYVFFSWRRNIKSDRNPITIRMDGDKTIKANFGKTWVQTLIEEACFIATAAYGSPLHPYVEIIQEFRDKYLMPNKLGRAFVNLYYKYSPFIADLISKHKLLKVVVRVNLLSIVAFSYSIIHFGPIITAVLIVSILILPLLLISFYRRKLSQLEAKDLKALASRW